MQEKLRILYLITDIGKGGAERFLVDICTELQKRKDVQFVIGSLLNNNNAYQQYTKDFEIKYLNFQIFSFHKKNECYDYKKLLDDFNPHIVHTNRFLAEFLSLYYQNENITYVTHGHDNMVQFSKLKFKNMLSKEKLTCYFEKQLLYHKKYRKNPTWIIANSKHTEAFYKSVVTKKMKDKVVLLQYGFNFKKFYNSDNKGVKGKLKLINVGSFQDKKNQKFILKIANELLKHTADFEITLLGDGKNKTLLEQQCKNQGLENYIIFKGNVNNVEDYLHNSHIYLHTAWYEPFGLVFLEAMASGLPVVTLDGKGNRDIIEQNKNGYLFYEENAELFAKTILELKQNTNKYSEMSEYCKVYSKKFDMEHQVDKFVEFYKSILK